MVPGQHPPMKCLLSPYSVIAKDGHGPHIPTIPAIVLAAKLAKDEAVTPGAMACLGLITLEEYLTELDDFAVEVFEE